MIEFYLEIFTNVFIKIIGIAPIVLVVWFGVDMFSSLFFGRGK